AVIEDPAKCRYLNGEVAVLDHCSWPDGSDELVFRDQISCARDEHAEDVEGARADYDWNEAAVLFRPEQAAPAPVEPDAFEQEDVGRDERVHASASQRPRRPGRPIFARNALNRSDFAGFRTVSEY